MDMNRIEQAVEEMVIHSIKTGSVVKMPYNLIDGTPYVEKAFKAIDMNKVMEEVTERLQHELAEKIVNKIVTEMETDIKQLMSHENIREDFRFMLRKETENILSKIKE